MPFSRYDNGRNGRRRPWSVAVGKCVHKLRVREVFIAPRALFYRVSPMRRDERAGGGVSACRRAALTRISHKGKCFPGFIFFFFCFFFFYTQTSHLYPNRFARILVPHWTMLDRARFRRTNRWDQERHAESRGNVLFLVPPLSGNFNLPR